MFRSVLLPHSVSGSLYLHSMPGRYESLNRFREDLAGHTVDRVIGLVARDEIERKSPELAQALKDNQINWDYSLFPIVDFGAPQNTNAFLQLAQEIAADLTAEKHILIHCAGGVGRTGMLAICVLLYLGIPLQQARSLVEDAGSCPEMPKQRQLIAYCAETLITD